MFAIEPMRRLRRVPLVVLIGLGLMVAGGALDVVVSLGSVHEHAHQGLAAEHLAHLVGIAGMVLVLTGLVAHGARRQLRQRAARNGGFDRNAHR